MDAKFIPFQSISCIRHFTRRHDILLSGISLPPCRAGDFTMWSAIRACEISISKLFESDRVFATYMDMQASSRERGRSVGLINIFVKFNRAKRTRVHNQQ
jgi:hypothetical protein